MDRGMVGCASGLNWCSFILMLFVTASIYWSWGYAFPIPGSPSQVAPSIASSIWVAGIAWSNYLVPCYCSGGICTNWCQVVSTPVLWSQITPDAACDPLSSAYINWAGPLGYCSFPANFVIPTPPPVPSSRPAGVTGYESYGNAPPGTTFNVPMQIISMQALTIIATITVFFAALLGCADAGTESRKMGLGVSATICSLIAWVFALAALCLYTAIPNTQKLQANPPQIYIPLWVNQSGNFLGAYKVYDVFYGPAWNTSIAVVVMVFVANVIHCGSLRFARDDSFSGGSGSMNKGNGEMPGPAASTIPTTAVPVPVAQQPEGAETKQAVAVV